MNDKLPIQPALPIHPWIDRLEQLPEGKGNYYYWGANYTVDPIIIADGPVPSILLIKRHDTGKWALPGGFQDLDEDEVTAALREVHEETGITLDDTSPQVIYKGPVEDPRSTRNAWPETTALLWRVGQTIPATAGDDATDTRWVPISELKPDLHGSHYALIQQALTKYYRTPEVVETTAIDGGHMGYRHFVINDGARTTFLKQHDTRRFTDSERATHSLEYLRKEHEVYQQLSAQTSFISPYSELIEENTLAIDCYSPEDGWCWRAPKEPSLQKRYIQEVLAALASLRANNYVDSGPIRPTHITMEREGWDSYHTDRDNLLAKLASSDINGSEELIQDLDNLRAVYAADKSDRSLVFSHGDIRQSNIAWHPAYGTKIVDWSWAGPGPIGLDTTSFLIDLAKNGIDIEPYTTHFNAHDALTLIGFWLVHSTWKTATQNDSVRKSQLLSAVTAHKLLKRFEPILCNN